MEKQLVILTGAKRYKFNNDDGEILQGTNVFYLALDQIKNDNVVGLNPSKSNFEYSYFDRLKDLKYPCLAEMSFNVVFGSNRPQIQVKDFNYLQDLKIPELQVKQ